MRHLFRCFVKKDVCNCLRRCYGSLSVRISTQTDQERRNEKNLHDLKPKNVSSKKRSFSSAPTEETIFKSPRPAEKLPVVSLSDYMFSRFNKFGSKNALVDDATGTTYTYSQLEELSRNVGSFLYRSGLRKNDVICYYGTNNPEFALLLLGCSSVGVILTTANPAYTSGELERHMEHSGAKMLVTVPPLIPKVQEAEIKNVIVIGGADGCRPFSDLLADDGKCFPSDVTIDPHEDIVILPYSSGTTGLPKGVMLSHFNVVANLRQFKHSTVTTTEDNNFAVLPFYHIYGMAPILFGTLQDGGTLVTTPGFDPEGFLKAIVKHKISQLHIVPPIVLFMARHPVVDKFDLSHVRNVICAAAPLGEALTNEFNDKRQKKIRQGYGLTETSPVVSLDDEDITVGSIGRLVSNTEAKFVNPETGKSLGINETGELCVRGPQNMKGYLENEKATKEMIDEDGWLHTGDVGHMGENGCIVVSDRLKELIKYKGLQVAPAELEDLLHKHPAVQDVAVIGMPDDRAGELPRAYVVLKPNLEIHAHDLMKYVEDHVSDYKKLRGGVEFMKEIPKSPSGKILRRVLKDQLPSSQI
ncbi:uncharacterized protein LOC132759159 [Ruditapes philippinarum]|uniref:uncharacterized protein LOC132759159 n=1 Tax=Ruditapes philippinarum TaxID=129788 RepID=UPI00295A7ED0|nr:uncharacterized protein LOC132759159 [Ruditapes philippinarum]